MKYTVAEVLFLTVKKKKKQHISFLFYFQTTSEFLCESLMI